ncbi:uncharacterized protein LOC121873351 [Homarus americanus]|uniref:uncharacterized protein LOC121873351 n=1 Tax=Homarus americanus TaxID=6706 RepID=UPI001C443F62|nr:uncharacterized protein LOC121873351 [Homarus americanus]
MKTVRAWPPVHIINTCISSTSDHFKLQDNLPKDAEEIHDTMVQVLTSLDKNSRQDLSEVMVHMAATIVRHVCWTVDKSKGVHTEVTKIEEVGGCVALLIGVCQSRAKLSTALMDAITRILTTATRDITSLLAISYLLKILAKDSGKISRYSLKQAVIATDSIFNQIVLPLSLDEDEESNIALGLYEKYTKMTGDYIKDLKSSLGVL